MSLSANDYLKRILLSPVYDVALNTELVRLPRLSDSLGNEIWLKREDQQPVKSFKLRGAYNKLAHLSEQQLQAGVVTASAGNHAQGVAYSARIKKIMATIVMPETTPDIKVDAVRNFGQEYVNVVLHGTSFDQAKDEALRLSKVNHYTMVPPFDDVDVIAGQGTIARELLEQQPDLDILFIAVGGGGLAAGISVYLKQLKPDIKIIAVESDESACLEAALKAGKPVALPSVGIFADGVAVKTIGEEPFRLCQQYVDDVITVNTDEICAAIKDIFDDTRVIAEPAGALSVAGIRKYLAQHDLQGKKLVAFCVEQTSTSIRCATFQSVVNWVSKKKRFSRLKSQNAKVPLNSFVKYLAGALSPSLTIATQIRMKRTYLSVSSCALEKQNTISWQSCLNTMDIRASTCQKTKWRSCTSDIWWADVRLV